MPCRLVKRSVPLRVLAGQIVHGEILVRRDPAAGNLATDHEHIMFAEPLGAAALAGVAVFLLIGAVELEQLFVLFAEAVGVLPQFVGDAAAQARLASLIPSVAERFGGAAGTDASSGTVASADMKGSYRRQGANEVIITKSIRMAEGVKAKRGRRPAMAVTCPRARTRPIWAP